MVGRPSAATPDMAGCRLFHMNEPAPGIEIAASEKPAPAVAAADGAELAVDLHDYGPRLWRLGFAALIGLVLTFFSVKAMTSSGRGPNDDPVGLGSVGMLAFAMFVLTTGFAHKILSKHLAAQR
jgi:hypothetical protein